MFLIATSFRPEPRRRKTRSERPAGAIGEIQSAGGRGQATTDQRFDCRRPAACRFDGGFAGALAGRARSTLLNWRCRKSITKETVALVDIGFKHTSVCVLDRGELATNRVSEYWRRPDDRRTGGNQWASAMPRPKASRWAWPRKLKPELQMQVMPLGREIRASLDFFEHQQDRPVTQVYISGGYRAFGNDLADAAFRIAWWSARPGIRPVFCKWPCPASRRWKLNMSDRN